MAKITFISGGCRSGKSSFAESLAKDFSQKIYLATAEAFDEEMTDRIQRHQEQRAEDGWQTVEEAVDLRSVFENANAEVILLDCVTLWINNLMYQNLVKDEASMAHCCHDFIKAAQSFTGDLIIVSNETGMGIMPMNQQARLFGDLAGRANQIFAQAADKVFFMVSGIPMDIKK